MWCEPSPLNSPHRSEARSAKMWLCDGSWPVKERFRLLLWCKLWRWFLALSLVQWSSASRGVTSFSVMILKVNLLVSSMSAFLCPQHRFSYDNPKHQLFSNLVLLPKIFCLIGILAFFFFTSFRLGSQAQHCQFYIGQLMVSVSSASW